MEVTSINYFELLPTENVCHILSFLEGKDIAVAECAWRRFREIIKDPEDLSKLRIKKYFSTFEDIPKATFEEKCAWAAKRLKVIEPIISRLKRINPYLYKANEDVYLYIRNGKIEILKRNPINPINGNPIKIAPCNCSEVINPTITCCNKSNSYNVFKMLIKFSDTSTIYSLFLDGSSNPLFKYDGLTPREKLNQFPDLQSFLDFGFKKMKNYLDPSQEIFLKSYSETKMVAAFFIKGNDIKFFRTTIGDKANVLKNAEITGLIKLDNIKVVFTGENDTNKLIIKFIKKGRDIFPKISIIS